MLKKKRKRTPTSAAKYLAMQASLMKGLPASFRRAALYVSSRAASICVATWAIWCCIPCNSKTTMTTPSPFAGTMSPGNGIHFGNSPGSQRCVFRTGSSAWCKELCCQSNLEPGQASESQRDTRQHTQHHCWEPEWSVVSFNLKEICGVLPEQRFQSCPRSASQWHTCTRDRPVPKCSSLEPGESTKLLNLTAQPCKTYS